MLTRKPCGRYRLKRANCSRLGMGTVIVTDLALHSLPRYSGGGSGWGSSVSSRQSRSDCKRKLRSQSLSHCDRSTHFSNQLDYELDRTPGPLPSPPPAYRGREKNARLLLIRILLAAGGGLLEGQGDLVVIAFLDLHALAGGADVGFAGRQIVIADGNVGE